MGALIAFCLLLAEPSSAGGLKILSFNAAGLPRSRLPGLAARLKESGYDLVALERTWGDKDIATLAKASGLPYYHARGRRGLFLKPAPAVLSRYPLLESARTLFTCRRSALRIWPRQRAGGGGVLTARIQTPQGALDVYRVQMIADLPSARFRTLRETQVFELSELVRERSKDVPFVILGDIGAGPEQPEHRILLDLLGLRDASDRQAGGERVFVSRREAEAKALPSSLGDLGHAAEEVALGDLRRLRLKEEADVRGEALEKIESAVSQMLETLWNRERSGAWIPIYGFALLLRSDRQISRLWSLKAKVETARILALSEPRASSR